jgi:hypothetical protein
MNRTQKWVSIIFGVLLGSVVIGTSIGVTAAIMQTSGLAVAQTNTLWNYIRDSAVGQTLTNGVAAISLYMYNGTDMSQVRGTATNGLQVDVTRVQGASTPSDAFPNPANTSVLWVLNSIFNGTTWDRARATTMTSAGTTGIQAVGAHMTDAVTNWPLLGDWVSGLVVTDASNAVSNPTTNTSTVVKASVGKVRSVNVNVIGTTSTVRLFNDATSPCDTNFVMQISTAVLATTQINHSFTVGICALTAGAAAADISILYR